MGAGRAVAVPVAAVVATAAVLALSVVLTVDLPAFMPEPAPQVEVVAPVEPNDGYSWLVRIVGVDRTSPACKTRCSAPTVG